MLAELWNRLRGAGERPTEVERLRGEIERQNRRIGELEKAAEEDRERLLRLQGELKRAVEEYRERLEKENPEVPREMLKGETVQDIKESLAAAKALAEKVKSSLEARAAEIRVPAGAPQRDPELENLSSWQKIKEGVKRSNKY